MLLDWLFLPILFFVGIITSYQDLKEGKIKNKWIIFGLIWALGIYFLLLICTLINQFFSLNLPRISIFYILKVFLNSIISLIFGYLLWYFNLWSAGDAKLFFIFSLLLPLKYYWKSTLPYFYSFTLLINTFIPALVFLFINNILYLKRSIGTFLKFRNFKKYKKNFFQIFKKKYVDYLKEGSGFLLIFSIFQIILGKLNSIKIGKEKTLLIFFGIFLLKKILKSLFKKTWFLVCIFFIILFYLINFYQNFFYQLIILFKNSFFYTLLFFIFSFFLSLEETKKQPFAIWLLIGSLITILLQGSLISFFLNPKSFLIMK